MIVTIVPARGGSKGIPQKNLRKILGVPLVTISIQHAIEALMVDRVIVSSDDDEIEATALQAGAEVIRRPKNISGDTASSESALLHVLCELNMRGETEPDLVVFLQATSPIRTPDDVDAAVKVLLEGDYDSVFSASPTHGFLWELRDGVANPLTYNPVSRPMRQQMTEQVVENGSIYVFKPWVLRDGGARLGGRIGIYRMGFLEALQIDEPEDLELAQRILESRIAGISSRDTDLY